MNHADQNSLAIDPASLGDRLEAAGFENVDIEVKDDRVRFAGTKAT